MRTLMQIRPILAALRSHKAAVTLLVLEIALTMAVLGNLVFIVHGGIRRADTPTGVAEHQIGVIQSIGVIGAKGDGTVGEALAAMRAVPGVKDVAYGGPPLWYSQREPVFRDSGHQHGIGRAYLFMGSQGLSRTLGLDVVQGQDFTDADLPSIQDAFGGKASKTVMPVLITRHLAQRLFGVRSPLGRMFYDGNHGMRVIGVVRHLRGQITGHADDDDSIVSEMHVGPEGLGGGFMIRADPAQLAQVLRKAAAALAKANPGHVEAKSFTMDSLRERYFRGDLAVGRMLIAIILILVVVTVLGVSGLASFWVQQRRRQIGMRRALGATRGDILQYFQVENFLIVSLGVVLGTACTFGLNLFLMHRFELPQLPLPYVCIGAATLWLIGQLSVLGPALRAARVPPVVATRSV